MNLIDPIAYQGAVSIGEIGADGLGNMFGLEWGWMVDGLSIMMYLVVGVVGFLVFTYAKGYMEGDIRYTWFFASFALFGGGMLVLVSAPNLIQLIVGWELVGVASYLLIGHYWEDHDNSSAGIKAFLVNKVADVGLFIGAIIIGLSVGSFRFTDIMDVVAHGDLHSTAGALQLLGGPRHLHRGDGQERPVPAARLAARRHGRAHPGLGADARRHHGHRRRLSARPSLPVLQHPGVRKRRPLDHHHHRHPHPVPHRPHRPGPG